MNDIVITLMNIRSFSQHVKKFVGTETPINRIDIINNFLIKFLFNLFVFTLKKIEKNT